MIQLLPPGLALALLIAVPAQAQDAPEPFVCPPLAEPVIRLDHGSRYKSADKSRSSFDKESNSEVEAQLKPVDDFITDMILAANAALSGTEPEAAECVVTGLAHWAEAGALGEMGSLNANLSVPSRLAGLAFAWAEVKPQVTDAAQVTLIEDWLAGLARATMTFFDTEAPDKAARNNLRAWAALAVARVGLTLDDKTMTDWADDSARLVACSADADGSLPLEMARKELALHYQLHAISALVPTAALLLDQGYQVFEACDGSLHRSIRFTLAAFANPKRITKLANAKQSYFNGSDKLKGFELAWAPAYLATFNAPEVAAFVEPFSPLANSKLGGLQSLLWPPRP